MSALMEILARNRAGAGVGLPAWCTAHPETLAAVLSCYRGDAAPVLVEATCNQVNQEGGYTGMTPAGFRRFLEGIAAAEGVAAGRIILGGDHLGPNPWRAMAAEQAMDRARAMVAAYVEAGFSKIHLDASMPCGGEVLPEEVMAERAADLALVAERAAGGRALAYVIGTEVPVPGGETAVVDHLAVTAPAAVARVVELHRAAFARRGLGSVMERVAAVVVQPGVDFGNAQVVGFDPARAQGLRAAVPGLGGPVYEAHSTDYQEGAALRALVQGHFGILKVGPELTFAFRQAVFALERLAGLMGLPSGVEAALVAAMRAEPADWRAYVEPGPEEARMMIYGLSDRVRYYWPKPGVQAALRALFAAIRAADPAPGLVAQVTGGRVGPVDAARLPETIIRRMVGDVVARYRQATGE
ncbi:tagatose-bisphosphate aldolase [Tabrizicola sp. TH137]|uniref:class II D-tagatose-bisphosphate aldolase non-catalytic subunit n=1 Tax=Tabrizicola sp. TH137 TaxID=2067452 RepID=UPI000C7C3658|nr:class II D-tagatose-bisphosphate aldolase, non-catalytic subunit [Tabrizicola sp. TH137]PLL14465.1 tagatose-bisphosphate aldolase [Tabrizicola sp. TH137]